MYRKTNVYNFRKTESYIHEKEVDTVSNSITRWSTFGPDVSSYSAWH